MAIPYSGTALRSTTWALDLRERQDVPLTDPFYSTVSWISAPFANGIRIVVRNPDGLEARRPDLTGQRGTMIKHETGVSFQLDNGESIKLGEIWWSRI